LTPRPNRHCSFKLITYFRAVLLGGLFCCFGLFLIGDFFIKKEERIWKRNGRAYRITGS